MMAMFIKVDVKPGEVEKTAGLAEKLVEVCPVNIFKLGSAKGSVEVVESNVDECTLCELCLKACPEGVKVTKLY
jgi:NAD-dependent dihydropyrimidine dehydrogenase PreA subunit